MKTILIPEHGVLIIMILGSNMSCINVLTCTQYLCNLILAVGFTFGANLTVRSSLNHSNQFITIGSSQNLKFDCWIVNMTIESIQNSNEIWVGRRIKANSNMALRSIKIVVGKFSKHGAIS